MQTGAKEFRWIEVYSVGSPLCYIPSKRWFSGEYSSSGNKGLWARASSRCAVTVDEELELLESSLRRLKIEYDVYFGGGSKKPPTDTLWRVTSLIKKYGDSQKLSFAQRYRFNALSQRYAIFSDLWRQKLKIKEEGYRRPQDAVLGIVGLRTGEEHEAAAALHVSAANAASKIACSNVDNEMETVRAFYDRMMTEKQRVGEQGGAPFESFATFLKKKTEQIRHEFKCEAVEYSLEIQGKQVKLKAKPRTP
jgi:hypothetical protein